MRKPKTLTPELLDLTKETYHKVIKDKEISKRELKYLKDLHRVIFGLIETDNQTIINEIRDISQWKIKVK